MKHDSGLTLNPGDWYRRGPSTAFKSRGRSTRPWSLRNTRYQRELGLPEFFSRINTVLTRVTGTLCRVLRFALHPQRINHTPYGVSYQLTEHLSLSNKLWINNDTFNINLYCYHLHRWCIPSCLSVCTAPTEDQPSGSSCQLIKHL